MLYIIIPTHKEPVSVKKRMKMLLKKDYPKSDIIEVNDKEGKGKGWAVREGLKAALHKSKSNNDIFAYIDGDLDIQPKMIRRLLPFLDEYDMVVGTKQVHGLPLRCLITILSRIYMRFFFGVTVDTQTGIKLFKKKAIYDYKSNGFLFDLEWLSAIQKRGNRIIEVPISADIKKNVSVKILIKAFLESLIILLNKDR